eukprot:1142540-Pelagomonas_calceolata.AAC.8
MVDKQAKPLIQIGEERTGHDQAHRQPGCAFWVALLGGPVTAHPQADCIHVRMLASVLVPLSILPALLILGEALASLLVGELFPQCTQDHEELKAFFNHLLVDAGGVADRKCPKLTLPLPIYPTCAATNEITHTFLYPALDNLKYLRALLLHLQFQASCPVQSQCIIDAGTHDPRSHYGHKQAGYLPHGEHIQNVPVALDVLIALQMTMRTGNE